MTRAVVVAAPAAVARTAAAVGPLAVAVGIIRGATGGAAAVAGAAAAPVGGAAAGVALVVVVPFKPSDTVDPVISLVGNETVKGDLKTEIFFPSGKKT